MCDQERPFADGAAQRAPGISDNGHSSATEPLLAPQNGDVQVADDAGENSVRSDETLASADDRRETTPVQGEGDGDMCKSCVETRHRTKGSYGVTSVTPLEQFTNKKWGKQKTSRKLRKYYKEQDRMIEIYEESLGEPKTDEEREKAKRAAGILAKVILLLNLLLLIAKVVAAVMSGSMSIVAAVVDSAVDLVSGVIIWWSARAMQRTNQQHYPSGRTRLEPIGIIVLSVIMAVASILVIKESIEKIITLAKSNEGGPNMEVSTIVICAVTIVTKLGMFIACYRVKSPSTRVLAQDQRNDVISNTVALAGGFIGAKWWKFADPIGALVISLYIIVGWIITGKEQVKQLSGHVADPAVIKRVTWVAMNFDPAIQALDTVRVYHIGINFLAEVHLVLPHDMPLKECHDIGEGLQNKLEQFPDIERAFVHVDYDFDHRPESEHKKL